YAGRSPEYPGLDQINFVLESPPTGCYIPLQVRAGNSVSNITTISVASNQSYCESTLGLSEAALRRLDDGGAVTLGGVGVTRINLFLGLSTDVALGLFARADADLAFRAAMLTDLGSLIYPVAVGSCVIFDQATAPEASLDLLTLLARAMPLSAGTKFTLSGKATVDLPRAPNGLYQNEGLAQFLSGGKWTMSGAGGSEVGAFSVSTTISPLITWIGPQEGEIARNSLRFTWSGGGSAPEDVVYLSGYSTIVNRVDPYQSQGKRFQCTAPAGPGSFTVPSVITAQLPAAPAESPSTAYFGSVGFSTRGGSPFTSAPLTAGGSIDGGVFAWVVRDERTVTFK
ncbi:MAG TPA: hypothetical protein VMZ52_10895, partial [Bryobacteraceae bacterium]|nr:hypothetical protein [Bryobacteraceae bacterium]